jgi:hypothetical protein
MGFDQLGDAVKENLRKLDTCGSHNFQPITPGLHGTKHECRVCRGQVDGLSARWYETGRRHGPAAPPAPPDATPEPPDAPAAS